VFGISAEGIAGQRRITKRTGLEIIAANRAALRATLRHLSILRCGRPGQAGTLYRNHVREGKYFAVIFPLKLMAQLRVSQLRGMTVRARLNSHSPLKR
jgi:hypothetical protein